MTYQQTAALLSLAMNYWDNICSKTNAEETAKAWAASLADVPYSAALKAVQELSKTHRFKPTVSEVREAAVKYSAYNVSDNWSMRLAWDRYTELGIPLPEWFAAGVLQLGSAAPESYKQVLFGKRTQEKISCLTATSPTPSACIPHVGTPKPPCAQQVTPKIPTCRISGTARSTTRK